MQIHNKDNEIAYNRMYLYSPLYIHKKYQLQNIIFVITSTESGLQANFLSSQRLFIVIPYDSSTDGLDFEPSLMT